MDSNSVISLRLKCCMVISSQGPGALKWSFQREPSFASNITIMNDSTMLHPPNVVPPGPFKSALTAMRVTHLGTLLWECGVAYHVGQLGVLRLFDLKHHMIRRGLKASGALGGLLTQVYG